MVKEKDIKPRSKKMHRKSAENDKTTLDYSIQPFALPQFKNAFGATRIVRGDRAGWRIPEQLGDHFDQHPLTAAVRRMENEYLAQVHKFEREDRLSIDRKKGDETRIIAGEKTKEAILELAAEYPDKGRDLAQFIASRLNCSARHVRRILNGHH